MPQDVLTFPILLIVLRLSVGYTMFDICVRPLVAAVCMVLTGCMHVGPTAIGANRQVYNETLSATNNEQLLLNIARVSQQEIPLFMDIPEVDGTVTLTGNAQGGVGNIGTIGGLLGSTSGSISYTESPIIKYIPLSGSALIEQIGTAIPADALVKLSNSGWGLAPILEFIVEGLTPSFLDNYRAIDLMLALDARGALTLESDEKDYTILYIRFGARGVLTKELATMIDPTDRSLSCSRLGDADTSSAMLWTKLKNLLGQAGSDRITLRTNYKPVRGHSVVTRSALGVLKQAESHDFAILHPDVANSVRATNKASDCFNGLFYYLETDQGLNLQEKIDHFWRLTSLNYSDAGSEIEARKRAYFLGHRRAMIIVYRNTVRPADAYVSTFHNGMWYWLDRDDTISKKNFAFLNQVLTLLASPESYKPNQTVISANR